MIAISLPRAAGVAELRVDVLLPQQEVERELARIRERMDRPGDPLHGMPQLPSPIDGLVFRYREADGDFYLFVEDAPRGRLAGYTVFSRLVELDRTAERYLRSPHSRYAAAYQQRGIARAVYRWALNAGMCLISGRRQSVGAHRLWQGLASSFERGYVQVRRRRLEYLGIALDAPALEDFDTRMVLLGQGWPLERFLDCTGCAVAGAH